ncbi:MAG: hypothetical protein KBD26_03705 [Candidatus Pacebacteria bacterium]|nr:hypothetical protein [Candidatus Paceibacterota bacterium]
MKKNMMISTIILSAVMGMTSCGMMPTVPPTPENTVVVGNQYVTEGTVFTYTFTRTISASKEDNRLQEGVGVDMLDLFTGGYANTAEMKFWQEAGRATRDNINAKLDQLYDAGYQGWTYTFTGKCQVDEDGLVLAITWNPW